MRLAVVRQEAPVLADKETSRVIDRTAQRRTPFCMRNDWTNENIQRNKHQQKPKSTSVTNSACSLHWIHAVFSSHCALFVLRSTDLLCVLIHGPMYVCIGLCFNPSIELCIVVGMCGYQMALVYLSCWFRRLKFEFSQRCSI